MSVVGGFGERLHEAALATALQSAIDGGAKRSEAGHAKGRQAAGLRESPLLQKPVLPAGGSRSEFPDRRMNPSIARSSTGQTRFPRTLLRRKHAVSPGSRTGPLLTTGSLRQWQGRGLAGYASLHSAALLQCARRRPLWLSWYTDGAVFGWSFTSRTGVARARGCRDPWGLSVPTPLGPVGRAT